MPLIEMILIKTVRFSIFMAIALWLFSPAIAKSDSIRIVAPILGERLLTQDENGFWADMIRQVLTSLEQPHELTALPLKRSLADFASEDFDCIWSLDKNLLRHSGVDVTGLIESEIVFEATQHVFLAPGLPVISSLDDLRETRVGIGSGSNYEKHLKNISAKVVLLSDQDSKLRMLENDRIDAFIGWLPSLLIMDTNSSLKSNLLDNNLRLSSTGAAFVCHDTMTNAAFINRINPAIRAYRTSDQFTALFKSYGASQMLENQNK